MSKLRLRIAERLVAAQHKAAMLTTFNEADMSAVIAMRALHKEEFNDQYARLKGRVSGYFWVFFQLLLRPKSAFSEVRSVTRVTLFLGVFESQKRIYDRRAKLVEQRFLAVIFFIFWA